MKNVRVYFLLLSIVSITSSLQAQVSDLKNKWALSANIGYTDVASDAYYLFLLDHQYTRTFTLSPTLGYFINNNQQIGMRAIFRNAHYEEEDSRDNKNTLSQSFGLGVYTRNYSWLFDHFGFYLESGLTYTYDQSNSTANYYYKETTDERRYTRTIQGRGGTIQLYFRPGLTWQVNQRIGIDFTTRLFEAGYRYNKQKREDEQKFSKSDESFWANISNGNRLLQNIQLGISIFI